MSTSDKPVDHRRLARLAPRCAHQFSRRSIERAHTYLEHGRVELREGELGGSTPLFAAVRGSRPRPYVVGVDAAEIAGEKVIITGCTCPFASEGSPCKHIFAVLLSIDRSRGADELGGAAGSGPPQRTATGNVSIRGLALTVDPLAIARFEPRVLAERELAWFGPAVAEDQESDDWKREVEDEDPRKDGASTKTGRNRVPPQSRAGERGRRQIEDWQIKLFALERATLGRPLGRSVPLSRGERRHDDPLVYVIDVALGLERGGLIVGIFDRQEQKGGTSKLRPLSLTPDEIDELPDPEDRQILRYLLASPASGAQGNRSSSERRRAAHESLIPESLYEIVVPMLAATGRLECHGQRVTWDDGEAWRLELVLGRDPKGRRELSLAGRLTRPESPGAEEVEVRDLEEPLLILASGLVLFTGTLARLDARADFHWVLLLRSTSRITFPESSLGDVLAELSRMRELPPLAASPDLASGWSIVRVPPRPRLTFARPPEARARALTAALSFEYFGHHTFGFGDPGSGYVDRDLSRVVLRDREAETEAAAHLAALGAIRRGSGGADDVDVRPRDLSALVLELASAGWYVESAGKRLRAPERPVLQITSRPGAFDLTGGFEYEEEQAPFPALLAAWRSGRRVALPDGSEGLLPEEWLAEHGAILELGEVVPGAIRFAETQAAILDLVTARHPDARTDEAFRRARARHRALAEPATRREPPTFRGTLREYQRAGLEWLSLLEELGLGGCLADDMGLGKTLQVLAHLLARKRAGRVERGPSLIVAPRALVGHWLTEAARFTPDLSVLTYTGADRAERADRAAGLGAHDLVVTTYGTVRRDIAVLRRARFDVIVFDEARALENSTSATVRACRALSAAQRVALRGTPIARDFSDLWSLADLLNPGMLGDGPDVSPPPADAPPALLDALARLVLRRTKADVFDELPDRTELTLWCELGEEERLLYRELSDHYREVLADEIREAGMENARDHVQEALLRLRQAACHPGLIDPLHLEARSSKLEVLLDRLVELTREGHRVLVSSRLPRLLELVHNRLLEVGVTHEYLEERDEPSSARPGLRPKVQVPRGTVSPETTILLSAASPASWTGPHSADYVFILDPAGEPEDAPVPFDRAPRVEPRPLFTYRLITRGTVEEKLVELGARKRRLAEALVREDGEEVPRITPEDLAALLG